MKFFNPVYSIILPFLFIFTIPIAAFAIFTSILAFSLLLFRVTIVYIELALAIIPHYLLFLAPSPKSELDLPPTKSLKSSAHVRRRKRSQSTSSNISGGTVTPTPEVAFPQSVGATRDFEGVGGWRLSDDDALWTNINSRLELPAHHERRHRRSLTGGDATADGKNIRAHSPEANMRRARTPPTHTSFGGDGYFPQVPTSPRLKRSASGITGTSTSSGSSKGSGLSMKQR